MSFIWAIIAGTVVGLIAQAVRPGKSNLPIWLTIGIGIVGAIVGNILATAIGVRHTAGIDWIRHILQIVVAVVLIGAIEPRWSGRRRIRG